MVPKNNRKTTGQIGTVNNNSCTMSAGQNPSLTDISCALLSREAQNSRAKIFQVFGPVAQYKSAGGDSH